MLDTVKLVVSALQNRRRRCSRHMYSKLSQCPDFVDAVMRRFTVQHAQNDLLVDARIRLEIIFHFKYSFVSKRVFGAKIFFQRLPRAGETQQANCRRHGMCPSP